MYVVLLSILLVGFVVYLLGRDDGLPPAANNNNIDCAPQAAQDDDATLAMIKHMEARTAQALAAAAAAPQGSQPPATVAPFESFDTTGAEHTERARALGQIAHAAIESNRMRAPAAEECNEQDQPCDEEEVWQNSFPGCSSFHIPIEGGDPAHDHRVWQGDLNPLLQERMALQAKEWNPYEHMRARQAWMQFLSQNMSGLSDQHTRPIDSLDAVDVRCANTVEPLAMY